MRPDNVVMLETYRSKPETRTPTDPTTVVSNVTIASNRTAQYTRTVEVYLTTPTGTVQVAFTLDGVAKLTEALRQAIDQITPP